MDKWSKIVITVSVREPLNEAFGTADNLLAVIQEYLEISSIENGGVDRVVTAAS
jgi:hypothetical protein